MSAYKETAGVPQRDFNSAGAELYKGLRAFEGEGAHANWLQKWRAFLEQRPLPTTRPELLMDFALSKMLLGEGSRRAEMLWDEVGKFSSVDALGWLDTALIWVASLTTGGARAAYRPLPDGADVETYAVYDLPRGGREDGPIRIMLLSDWGTGTPEAAALAEKLAATGECQLVLHLGDVYYSGTRREQSSYVTKVLRKAAAGAPVFNMAGNHDYYSGGHGFFEELPALNGVQESSFFCLRGKHWQLVCLDTGVNDSNPLSMLLDASLTFLDDGQKKWAQAMVAAGKAKGLKTILFSHHQLFSRKETVGKAGYGVNPHLLETFRGQLADVSAWFWGHEHAFSAFEPFLGLERGRLVGFGAVPEGASEDVFGANPENDFSEYGGQPPRVRPGCEYGKSGMLWNTGGAVLTLSASEAKAEYYQLPIGPMGVPGDLGLFYSETF